MALSQAALAAATATALVRRPSTTAKIEGALVLRAGVLVIRAGDIAPAAVPEPARDVVLQPGIGASEEPATVTTCKALAETCNVNTQFFLP
jgi:hypothetical protein